MKLCLERKLGWASLAIGLAVLWCGKSWLEEKEGLLRARRLAEETQSETGNRCSQESKIPPTQYFTTLPDLNPWNPCGQVTMVQLLQMNVQVGSVSYWELSATNKVLFIVQKEGSVWMANVETSGPAANWDLVQPRSAIKFRSDNCMNSLKFCDPVSTLATTRGFMVVDRNRVQEFSYSYGPSAPDIAIAQIGVFNSAFSGATSTYKDLYFPSYVAMYYPYNSTAISSTFPMTPDFPHAGNRFFFVTDAGKNRLLFLNGTSQGQLDILDVFDGSQAGGTFNNPAGVTVQAPACEALFRPTLLNIYVADRGNDRLVKLDLAYVQDGSVQNNWIWTQPYLRYSGAYYFPPDVTGYGKHLNEPITVQLFNGFIFVCEALGNRITVLQVNYNDTTQINFVSHLVPPPSVQLTGHIAISPLGHVWYTHLKQNGNYALASFYMRMEIRYAFQGSILQDLRNECVNDTWAHTELLHNHSLFYDWLGYRLNASMLNWRFPDRPNWVNVSEFNLSTYFNLQMLNDTFHLGSMRLCVPPPLPSTPPMLSGNPNGWNVGDNLATGPTITGSSGPRGSGQVLAVAIAVLAGLMNAARHRSAAS